MIFSHIIGIHVYCLFKQITQLKIASNPFAKGFRDCDMDFDTVVPHGLVTHGMVNHTMVNHGLVNHGLVNHTFNC